MFSNNSRAFSPSSPGFQASTPTFSRAQSTARSQAAPRTAADPLQAVVPTAPTVMVVGVNPRSSGAAERRQLEERYGPVRHCEHVRGTNVMYVSFASVDACSRALADGVLETPTGNLTLYEGESHLGPTARAARPLAPGPDVGFMWCPLLSQFPLLKHLHVFFPPRVVPSDEAMLRLYQ